MDGIGNAEAEGLSWAGEGGPVTKAFHPENPVHPI